jgi:tRNA-binding protein
MISWEDFEKVDIRVGEITSVEHLENARYTTHKLTVNFGDEIGEKKSCARVINYTDEELLGKRILAVLNFPPKQIGKHMSEVLTLGVPDANGEAILVSPDKDLPLGGKLY